MKKYRLPLRLSAFALACTLALSMPLPVNASDWRPVNPVISDDGTSTWDCLYFGKYWQNDTNGDGVADENDEKEYIKWRVLSVDGDDAFLVADQNLDVQPYNTTYEEVLWKTCTLRSWLNGFDASMNQNGIDYTADNFMDAAFDETSQEAILLTSVHNISPTNQIVNDTDTEDYLYLLSMEEIMSTEYGFTEDNRFEPGEPTRHSSNTAYLADKPNMAEAGVPTFWWLRTQGKNLLYASFLRTYGFFSQNGINVDVSYIGVRPALHLDLTKNDCYFAAGTVSSDGTMTEPDNESSTMESASTANASDTDTEAITQTATNAALSISALPDMVSAPSDYNAQSVSQETNLTTSIRTEHTTTANNTATSAAITTADSTKTDAATTVDNCVTEAATTSASVDSATSTTQSASDSQNTDRKKAKAKKKKAASSTTKKNKKITVGNNCYKITSSDTVTWTGIKKAKKSVSVPNTIKVGKKKYRVTKVKASASKKNRAIKTLTFKNKKISL